MAVYNVTMKHSGETLEALSRMQYDLFCKRNRYARMIVSVCAITAGVVNYSQWWGILLIAYGCYLTTSIYSSSDRTAHKLARQLKEAGLDFPESEYRFESGAMHIISLPEGKEDTEPLAYSRVHGMGEDGDYYYIFRNEYGGYMIPKPALGDRTQAFRDFIEKKTGKVFINPKSPFRRALAFKRKFNIGR